MAILKKIKEPNHSQVPQKYCNKFNQGNERVVQWELWDTEKINWSIYPKDGKNSYMHTNW